MLQAAKKTAPSHGLKWLFCLFVKVVNRGTVFGAVNPAYRCGLCCRLPSPTIRPREQTDLERFRSFEVKKCEFGF